LSDLDIEACLFIEAGCCGLEDAALARFGEEICLKPELLRSSRRPRTQKRGAGKPGGANQFQCGPSARASGGTEPHRSIIFHFHSVSTT
jgi:hypothetical protein